MELCRSQSNRKMILLLRGLDTWDCIYIFIQWKPKHRLLFVRVSHNLWIPKQKSICRITLGKYIVKDENSTSWLFLNPPPSLFVSLPQAFWCWLSSFTSSCFSPNPLSLSGAWIGCRRETSLCLCFLLSMAMVLSISAAVGAQLTASNS